MPWRRSANPLESNPAVQYTSLAATDPITSVNFACALIASYCFQVNVSKFKPSRETVSSNSSTAFETGFRRPSITRSPKVDTAIVTAPAGLESPLPLSADSLLIDNPARQFAFKCTLVFLFFRYSFVHEFISSAIHIDTHMMIILGVVCYAAWFVAGGIFAAYSERLAWVWTGFLFWFCLATVTSSWKGGSLGVILPYLRTVFPLLLLIPAVTTRFEDLKKILNVIGIAGTTTVLFGLVHRDFTQGRMDIATEGGTIQDPNDFAAHLIMLIPAIAYVMFAKERSIFVKVFGAGIIGAALLEIMSTGSRGGFVALLITTIYIALTASPKVRFSLMVGIPLLGMLALPFVPHQSVQRLESIFNSNEESRTAAESSEARRALLMASLVATANHPLFGVGPGTFEEYEADLAAEHHQKGMWHETHNGYTQISSECGIPALLFYLAAVFITFKSLNRASKVDLPFVPAAAKTFAIMAVAYSASIIFLANAYKFNMLTIGAFTIAINQMIARHERTAR